MSSVNPIAYSDTNLSFKALKTSANVIISISLYNSHVSEQIPNSLHVFFKVASDWLHVLQDPI